MTAAYDADGFDADGFDIAGSDRDGFDRQGYDAGGFNRDGIHRDTHTEFNSRGLTCDGSTYNSLGYDCYGYDCEGYDSQGYDSDGYDSDGEDSEGNTRCDNGECRDGCCECHTRARLLDYDDCVLQRTNWPYVMGRKYARHATTLGMEIEMVARQGRSDAITDISDAYNTAYAEFTGRRMRSGCICKRDGSLPSGGGFEFVTVPMTLAEHVEVMRKAWPQGAIGGGCVNAWNVPGYDVGMHVALSAASCSRLLIGKISAFVNHYQNRTFNIHIAGRNCEEYAAFSDASASLTRQHPRKTVSRCDDKYQALHYKAGPHLLEFRMFRASSKVSTVLKNLSYVAAVRQFCMESAARQSALHYGEFLRWMAKPANRKTFVYLHKWMLANSKPCFSQYRLYCGKK